MTRIERIGDATLYLADCLEILPTLGPVDAVVTDPVWPNAPISTMNGSADPVSLFRATSRWLRHATRVVIQLGCDSDPAMLDVLAMPFLRTQWLEFACPTYKGRLLHTGDVAYSYGEWPPPRPGAMVIPGRCISTRSDAQFMRHRKPGQELGGHEALPHPMPRRLEHVSWLVKFWSGPEETVLDPFMGSGTTGVACAKLGRKFIGIEIDERYFQIACRRIEEAYRQPDFFIAPPAKAEQLALSK